MHRRCQSIPSTVGVCALWLCLFAGIGEGLAETTSPPPTGQHSGTQGGTKDEKPGEGEKEKKPEDSIEEFGKGKDGQGNPLDEDQGFKNIVAAYDRDGDGVLSPEEAKALGTSVEQALLKDPTNEKLGQLLDYANNVSSPFDTGNSLGWLIPLENDLPSTPVTPRTPPAAVSPPSDHTDVAGQTFGNPGGGGTGTKGGATLPADADEEIETGGATQVTPGQNNPGSDTPPAIVRSSSNGAGGGSGTIAAGIQIDKGGFFGGSDDVFSDDSVDIDGDKLSQLERNLGGSLRGSGTGGSPVVTPPSSVRPTAPAPTAAEPDEPSGGSASGSLPKLSGEPTQTASLPKGSVTGSPPTGFPSGEQRGLASEEPPAPTGSLVGGTVGPKNELFQTDDGGEPTLSLSNLRGAAPSAQDAEETREDFFATAEESSWGLAWDSIRAGVEKVVNRLSQGGDQAAEEKPAEGEAPQGQVVSLRQKASDSPAPSKAGTIGSSTEESVVAAETLEKPTGLTDFLQEMVRRNQRPVSQPSVPRDRVPS